LEPDTTDLRSGAPFHESLLSLLPLVGVWHGTGSGVSATTGADFSYGQQITFAHDGRPFLAYEARAWLLDGAGKVIRQAWRESGFWRCGPGEDDIEVVLSSNTGLTMQYAGEAGDQRWELASSSVISSPTAKLVDGERRLYAVLGSELVYVSELAPAGMPYAPHLNARLTRMARLVSDPA
jgi:hypothetical protein